MKTSKTPLFFALAASLICWLLPFGRLIAYPFTLFVTLVHEGGHVLMALATGSPVFSMAIAPDASGLTLTAPNSTLSGILIANAGYLSATAYGTLVLWLANGHADCRKILKFSAILVTFLVLAFTLFVKDWFAAIWASGLNINLGMKLFTLLAGLLIALSLWLISKAKNQAFPGFIANFLGLECIFNGLGDIKTVLALSVYSTSHSDAQNLAELTGIPSVVWALGWGLVSLWVIALTFKAVLKNRS
ncbi:MAG: M50 family metallopeptidase [Candidatus Methylumidiphilus sp.]